MKVSDIPKKRLNELNSGQFETKNLTEWLAVDQKKLLGHLSKENKMSELDDIKKRLPSVTVPKQIAWVGIEISQLDDLDFFKKHPSDIVRCWACYAYANQSKDLKKSLESMKSFAADDHFGIREVAWMAVREKICDQPTEAVSILSAWAKSKDANIRRFASEATRPRGVWAKHIGEFKKDPKPAEKLLNLLFQDPSKYVQDSVGNWLNDAAKDNPEWVTKVVTGWTKKSKEKSTEYIIKRATRSLK